VILGSTPLFFENTPGTEVPLTTPQDGFSNETGTAQSIPLVDQGAAAREGIPESRVQAFINRATLKSPANPAAPKTPTTATAGLPRWAVIVGALVAVGIVAVVIVPKFRRKGA
jgi:hypothetical protein